MLSFRVSSILGVYRPLLNPLSSSLDGHHSVSTYCSLPEIPPAAQFVERSKIQNGAEACSSGVDDNDVLYSIIFTCWCKSTPAVDTASWSLNLPVAAGQKTGGRMTKPGQARPRRHCCSPHLLQCRHQTPSMGVSLSPSPFLFPSRPLARSRHTMPLAQW